MTSCKDNADCKGTVQIYADFWSSSEKGEYTAYMFSVDNDSYVKTDESQDKYEYAYAVRCMKDAE